MSFFKIKSNAIILSFIIYQHFDNYMLGYFLQPIHCVMWLTLYFRWEKIREVTLKSHAARELKELGENKPLRIVSGGEDLRPFFLLKSSEQNSAYYRCETRVFGERKNFSLSRAPYCILDISRNHGVFFRIWQEVAFPVIFMNAMFYIFFLCALLQVNILFQKRFMITRGSFGVMRNGVLNNRSGE